MTLVMTLLVRDEIDIVATNIEFHLDAGVDVVIATDNRSTDGTVDLLGEYERLGVLRLLHEPDDDYAQAKWVTRMARMAATDFDADWVINNDADEFWWTADGDLPALFASLPQDCMAVEVERANFIARPDDRRAFWQRMTTRQQPSVPHPGFNWPTLGPKVCHRGDPAILVAQGNHAVRREGEDELLPAMTGVDLEILHFPVRSRDRFENKIVLGGQAYERNTELPPEAGKIWRNLYDVHRQGAFDDAYDDIVLTDRRVEADLADGTLVEDLRLKNHLADLADHTALVGAISVDPPAPATRGGSLVDRLLRRGAR